MVQLAPLHACLLLDVSGKHVEQIEVGAACCKGYALGLIGRASAPTMASCSEGDSRPWGTASESLLCSEIATLTRALPVAVAITSHAWGSGQPELLHLCWLDVWHSAHVHIG